MRIFTRRFLIFSQALIFLLVGFAHVPLQPTPVDFSAIDRYVLIQMEAANIPGAGLAIVHDGRVVHTAGYGIADSGGTPVTSGTLFILGSTSKGITALAVMQLVAQEKLDLDMPVQIYLPWFSLADSYAASQITPRMLLNQTSGLGYNDGTRPLYDRPGEYTLEERVRQMSTLPVYRTPGASFEYSNYNYMVLGAVVEAISGQPYKDYVRENIFSPLGMEDSAASLEDDVSLNLADPYRWWFGFPVPVNAPYPKDAVPAGFIIASADDMSKYLAFQQSGSPGILPSELLNSMHTSCVSSGDEVEYCYGWVRGKFGGADALFHEGSAQGYYSVIAMEPEGGWGLVVLTNANQMLSAPANGIAATVFSHLVNASPLAISHNFRWLYAGIDFIVIALTSFMFFSILRLPRWKMKLLTRGPNGFFGWVGRIGLPVLAELIVPFLVWIFLPQGAGFPMWKVMGIFQPDLTIWLFLIAGLFVLRGFLRICVVVQYIAEK